MIAAMRWALACLLLGACYRPDPPEGAPCSEGDRCPSPLHWGGEDLTADGNLADELPAAPAVECR